MENNIVKCELCGLEMKAMSCECNAIDNLHVGYVNGHLICFRCGLPLSKQMKDLLEKQGE